MKHSALCLAILMFFSLHLIQAQRVVIIGLDGFSTEGIKLSNTHT